jgi:NADH-quinone oxidoreductase subunit I
MYCGICVEVCPYDALFWSPEFEYAEGDITRLTHEMERLEDWMSTVLPPPPLEEGAMGPAIKAAAPVVVAPAEVPPAPELALPMPAGLSEAEFVEQRAAAGRLVRRKVYEEEIAKGSDPATAEERAKAAELQATTRGIETVPPKPAPDTRGRSAPSGGMSDADAAEVRRKVYEEEMAKGSDPRIAEGRAKAAEMRARKGTLGPGG